MGHPDVGPEVGVTVRRDQPPPARSEGLPGADIESTPAMAVAVQAKAAVEARYAIALGRPRNWNTVRLKLLDACDRPLFAEKARYSKPVGNGSVVGPSIRFTEEALRAMGNALVESYVIQEDEDQRIVRVSVTDLEANLTYPQDIVVRKEIERKFLKDGQPHKGKRLNSKGETVYLVQATDDDLAIRQNALTSKSIRTNGLRVLPSDILEECMERVAETVKKQDKSDPAKARKKLLDAFHGKGVEPADLVAYLGHPIEQMHDDELDALRLAFTALQEGETTWQAIMEARWNELSAGKTTAAKTQAKANELKAKIGAGKKVEEPKPETEEERVRREDMAEAGKVSGKARQREPGEEE